MKEDIQRTRKNSTSATGSAAAEEEPKSDGDKTENSESPSSTQGEEEVRSKEKGGEQLSDANSGKEDIKIEYLPLELSSFQSTKEFVRLFKERNLPLHILVNNAAISSPVYSECRKYFINK